MKPLTISPAFTGFDRIGRILQFAAIALLMSCQVTVAQINQLNGAERSNVAAAINALKQLIDDGRIHSPNKAQQAELNRIKTTRHRVHAMLNAMDRHRARMWISPR